MNLRDVIFSKWSKILHTTWFVVWFVLHLSINDLTLIVSLEAIYLELFLGDQNNETDDDLDEHKQLIKEIHQKVHK